MGAIGIVALVIVVLIVSAIGFQNLLAAIGVAIVFALFLRYITDEYFEFLYGLSVAIVSLGIAGILSIFIDVEFWGFWIAYIVVLLFWGFSLNRSVVKIEKEAQPVLKDLQDFLEDYAHFMPDYDRRAEVYWEDRKIQIKLWTWDAKIKRDIYRECDRAHIDPNPVFFGEYKPISKRYYNCYMLLDEGTPAFGEDSLVYTWPFAVLGQKGYIFPVISNRMKDRYSGSFDGNKDMFTIRFDKTK
mgnify:CR=1 FL=1